jgi:Ran GTPase-activating protein (RanGAP) involved in mRNA processing and transport
MTDESLAALAEALKADQSVTALDLSHNTIEDAGAVALAEAIAANPKLAAIDLSHNAIGNDGAEALAKALATDKLAYRALHLGRNPITAAGKRSLSQAIEATLCVVDGVPGLDKQALAFNAALANARRELVKPRIRSLSALTGDRKEDHFLAEVGAILLKRTARALAASLKPVSHS